jgi:hypothetical protein
MSRRRKKKKDGQTNPDPKRSDAPRSVPPPRPPTRIRPSVPTAPRRGR